MNLMTLTARLVLDDSEFNKSVQAKESGFSDWGSKIGKLAGSAFVKAFSAATDFIMKSINVGMDFDARMSQVLAISGATEEEFKTLNERAKELGASTKFTAEQVGEAFYYMAVAGWKPEQMLNGIAGVLDLAAASGENLGTVSDIVTDALTAFGLTAEDTGHFVDVLAKASANSNTTVAKMGETFKYLAPVAGQLGFSVDDIAVGVGLLANSGIKASQAGTALNRIMMNMINPTEGASDAMERLGLSLYDDKGNIRSFGDIIEQIQGLTAYGNEAEMTAEQVAKIIEQIDALGLEEDEYNDELTKRLGGQSAFLADVVTLAGARGLPAFLALMGATDDAVEQLQNAIENSEGSAQSMAATMLDNLQGDITILNSAIEGLQILVSDEFKGTFRDFVQFITEGVGELSESLKEGGMLGMFTTLTDWIINGITSALTDSSITTEGAAEFGEALGKFIGNLISKLVSSAPALIDGLFKAGINLAGGMLGGLFYGLFGITDDETDDILRRIQNTENEAIGEAEANAAKAQGILAYMESLQEKFGAAATNTEAWKAALEELQQVLPGVSELINTETGELTATNEQLSNYINNVKDMAIEEAKKNAMQSLLNEYTQAVADQATAGTKMQIAQAIMESEQSRLLQLIQEHDSSFTGIGSEGNLMDFMQLYNIAGMSGYIDPKTLDAMESAYSAAEEEYESNSAKVATLSGKITSLGDEIDIVNAAMASLGSAASSTASIIGIDSGSVDGSHASGAWNIPYDDYKAVLHRGEMVLSAAQARDYRAGTGSGFDAEQLYSVVAAAVAEAVSNIQINMDSERVGNAVAETVDSAIGRETNSARYAT